MPATDGDGTSLSVNRAVVDHGALRRNMAALRSLAGPDIKVIAALKANAYGHGAVAVARTLAEEGQVFALATGSFPEALAMRGAGVRLPILMFGGTLPEATPTLLAHGLIPTVWDLAGARAISAAATEPSAVYIKVDAGLGRLGIALPDALDFVRRVMALPRIRVEGIYTHLSFRDETGRAWSGRRLGAFDALLGELDAAGLHVPVRQALASSALLAGLSSRGNAVCPGHLLYGVASVEPAVASMAAFRPVLRSIVSRLIHVAPVKAGMRDAGPRPPSRLGVIPLGLAEGYGSPLGERGARALIRGRRVPLCFVSLEHITLDLSDAPDAAVGDEVVLLGPSGRDEITLAELSAWQGRRMHEVLMAFDRRLPVEHVGDRRPLS